MSWPSKITCILVLAVLWTACTTPKPAQAPSESKMTALSATSTAETVADAEALLRVQQEVRRCFATAETAEVLWTPFAWFGPPAMSYGLLGQAWWSWDSEGHDMEAAQGQVIVAVVDADQWTWAEAALAPQPDRRCDVRVVERRAALAYLEAQQKNLADVNADWAKRLRQQLATLQRHLRR